MASICIIDGDRAVRDSLATLMQISGHDVSTFATGGAFLDAVDSIPLGCVVCEAELPDTSGISVRRALTRRKLDVPFALLVSRTHPAIVTAARKAGIRDVFYKPLVNRRLIAFVAGC